MESENGLTLVHCSYNTTSNLTRVVKTPGGQTRLLHIKKRGTAPKCGDCGVKLPGVSLPDSRIVWKGKERFRAIEASDPTAKSIKTVIWSWIWFHCSTLRLPDDLTLSDTCAEGTTG
jgi:ribosomal protein L34E